MTVVVDWARHRAQELCESRGGHPGLPVQTVCTDGLCGHKATLEKMMMCNTGLRSCVKVEVAVMGSPSRMISLDVEQYLKMEALNKPRVDGGIFCKGGNRKNCHKAQLHIFISLHNTNVKLHNITHTDNNNNNNVHLSFTKRGKH